MKKQEIKHLTDIEHVLARPGMYIGSTTLSSHKSYVIEDDRFIEKDIEYVPGLVKLFNELIDNSVDEFVRTKGKFANKVDIEITNEKFTIQDNGRGIPVEEIETHKGKFWSPTLAWTELKAGSNFDDNNSTTIGTNGVGSSLCSIFSKEFIGISNDDNLKCTVTCKNNNEEINTKVGKPTGKQGVYVSMIPDIEKFGITEITDNHIKMIEQRLYNLSVSYPDITFKLNNKRIKIKSKNFLKMFGDSETIFEDENFSIGVFHSDTDEFKHFSLMNGLTLSAGGSHIDYISNGITRYLRDKIVKKYKTIKLSDIKRKLFLVVIMKDFQGPKYETQTKEKLTNPTKDISAYFRNLDLEKFSDKIYKNKSILDSIIDYFRIAEEFKKQQELKGLDKPKKKIKSEKYIKPIGKPKILLIVEGESALGGLMPAIGRDGIGYYSLKGKPLNVWDATQQKFTANKELTELYQIIKQENYEKIIYSTDQDLDGYHIRILLSGFIIKYLPEYKDKVGMLQTPVKGVKKNKKLIRWYYNLNDEVILKPGEVSKYYKGLGSHDKDTLKMIIKTDGLDKMIDMIEWDDLDIVDDWLSNTKINIRKEAIMNNDFSIAKL